MPRRWSNSDSSHNADPRFAELSDHRICPCRGRHPAIQRRPHTVSNALRAIPPRFFGRAARHSPIRPPVRKRCAEGSGALAARRNFPGATGRQTNPGNSAQVVERALPC